MSQNQRRTFIASLGSLAALTLFSGRGVTPLEASPIRRQKGGRWDLSWVESLNGKHKQVFDLGSRDLREGGNPLRVPRNYMNAHNTVSGIADADLATIVGVAGAAFPLNASDRLWKTYALGEIYQITDPATGKWSERNFYVDGYTATKSGGATSSINALLKRGTIFWQCYNALIGTSEEIAPKFGRKPAEVRADFESGLHPWVKLIPAHTMLIGLVQERGCAYEKI